MPTTYREATYLVDLTHREIRWISAIVDRTTREPTGLPQGVDLSSLAEKLRTELEAITSLESEEPPWTLT